MARTKHIAQSASRRKQLLFSLLVVTVASLVFAYRNHNAFTLANFYAEDATVFFDNLFTMNPIRAFFEPFNGYLVTGLYLLSLVAVGLNSVFGGGLVSLPIATAAISSVFLGFTASLPYLLFRKELGIHLSLAIVFFTAFVPLQSFDYAIIGTIGNLKFVFLYIAFLLVLYRQKRLTTGQYVVVDTALLLCATTNAAVPFLVPLILWPQGYELVKKLLGQSNTFKITPSFISACLIVLLSAAYMLVVFLKGIPELPGYLDTPFKKAALLPILDRSTYYGWLYPFTAGFNSFFVIALLLVTALTLLKLFMDQKQQRFIILAAIWTIFLGTGLLIVSRPGISEFYLIYGHGGGADQFFFAQNMIFIFATGWLLRDKLVGLKLRQARLLKLGLLLYILLAIPQSTSFGESSVTYRAVRPLDDALPQVCRRYADQEEVTIDVYPSPALKWRVDRDMACD